MIRSTASTDIATPTVPEVRESLERLLGPEFTDVWQDVCLRACIAPEAHMITDVEFDELLEAMCARGSICRVIAMSWKIRRTAARKLAEIGR
jgi:hypothetical protein